MKKVLDKKNCMGCTACMNICPVGAITMEEDEEGFRFPVINEAKCINCGACRRTCPVINTNSNIALNKCYACYSKDEESKFISSSGGIFYLIANYVLDKKGIVIGAAFNENNHLEHFAINKKSDLNKLLGSKYLQSDLKGIFKYIREKVTEELILFVGTPCQVAGLKAFLKKDYDNLITIDVICHGVPSPGMFRKYVDELENKEKQKLENYIFRDKATGWKNYSNTAVFANKRMTELAGENCYMKLFLSDVALRESCYNCNFKLGNKYSDITLGDFWGIEKTKPKMYNKSGVSALIVNTDKGVKIFNNLREYIVYEDCNLDDILEGNVSLEFSSERPLKRDMFFKDMDRKSIKKLETKYCYKNIVDMIFKKFKKEVKKMIRYEK